MMAETDTVESHTETIRCPECDRVQEAKVEHTWPFWTWLHHCAFCGYAIQESEWEKETDNA